MWIQKRITLKARPRGFHLVDREILAALPELPALNVGLLHLWLQHTSASLTINENADPLVPSSGTPCPTIRPTSSTPMKARTI